MVRSHKALNRLLSDVGEPQDELKSNEVIGKLVKAKGNSQHDFLMPPSQWVRYQAHFSSDCEASSDEERTVTVLMPSKFRNTVMIKRGGFVVVELYDPSEVGDLKANRVHGDIANVVRNQKDWQKRPYWPEEYKEQPAERQFGFPDSSSDEEEDEE